MVYNRKKACPPCAAAQGGQAKRLLPKGAYMGKIAISEERIAHRGREIYGKLYLPEGRSVAAAVFSHGFNGSHADFTPFAERLAAEGVAAFCYDFCGGSVNAGGGFPTESMTLTTELEDLLAVMDFILSGERTRGCPLFLFGASQGGLVSALAAARRQADVRGAALLFPALCIPEDWRARFPSRADIPEKYALWGMTLGKAFFEDAYELDVFAKIAAYTGPVLLMHGDADAVVPLSYSVRARDTYARAELVLFEGEGHGFSMQGNEKVYVLFADFIRKHV